MNRIFAECFVFDLHRSFHFSKVTFGQFYLVNEVARRLYSSIARVMEWQTYRT